MKLRILIPLSFFVAACAHASVTSSTCESDSSLQRERSAELLRLVAEDQSDRARPYYEVDWSKVNARDLARRKRVAEIFGEGCFHTAADYASAALVFQHGTTADHFYQTFLWASRAVELGDSGRRWTAAAGLDRYLVKTGRRQLFGTQFSRSASGVWCIQQVEPTFPKSRRRAYLGRTLTESIEIFLEHMKINIPAKNLPTCEPALARSRKGTVPGFW